MNDITIKIAVAGNVDSGKSTLTGVLMNNKLDDGRGSSRSSILRNKHEKETGRTSCISHNSFSEVVNDKRKILSLIDLAGHEKYLKTTIFGLSGLFADFGLVLVSANMGITQMTREHMMLLLFLKIPFVILVTKIDMVPENIKNLTINKLKKMMNIQMFNKKSYIFPEDENKFKDEMIKFSNLPNNLSTFIPIIPLSNKTGVNINNLKSFLLNLSPKDHWMNENIDGTIMYIDSKFNVRGIGLVVSGTVRGDPIKINDKLWIGPINDKFIPFKVRSIHNNIRENVNQLNSNDAGCIAIRFINKEIITKNQIRKGVIVISNENFKKNVVESFKAEITILNHSSTITDNYTPVIHCGLVRQTAKINILEINDKKSNVLRSGSKAIVNFKFCYKKEYLETGKVFFFRDGNTKGYGTILEIFPNI
jgi:elongation factor 1-alpha